MVTAIAAFRNATCNRTRFGLVLFIRCRRFRFHIIGITFRGTLERSARICLHGSFDFARLEHKARVFIRRCKRSPCSLCIARAIRENIVDDFVHARAVRIARINWVCFVDKYIAFRAHFAHVASRNAKHIDSVCDASIARKQVVHHMNVSVTAAWFALVGCLPPVEHVGHIQLAFAFGFIVRTADEIRKVVRTLFLVAKNAPRKRYVICTFYHIGIAILTIPEFTVVNPYIFGTVIFNGKVVPSLLSITARPLNHDIADDNV